MKLAHVFGTSLVLFASCAFADSLPADKLALSFLGKYAERTKIVRSPGVIEIDAKAALTAFYAEVARRLRAARSDLMLWVNSQIMMNTSVAGIRDADYTIRNDRWAGLDAAKLNAAIPNLMLGETFEPADYRFRGSERFDSDADYEAQRQQYGKRESWDLIRGAAYPVAGQHDRYFESAMGRDSENLSCDWLQECTWRVSTITPPDFHALEHFVKPLRHQDVLGMSKGGFLIGTYGMERHLAAFAQAFRALPAVTMRDVGERDGVMVRQANFDGHSYFYVVNTEAAPRTVAIGFPPASKDLVSGKNLVGGSRDTHVTLALKPYELRSFVAPCGKPRFE